MIGAFGTTAACAATSAMRGFRVNIAFTKRKTRYGRARGASTKLPMTFAIDDVASDVARWRRAGCHGGRRAGRGGGHPRRRRCRRRGEGRLAPHARDRRTGCQPVVRTGTSALSVGFRRNFCFPPVFVRAPRRARQVSIAGLVATGHSEFFPDVPSMDLDCVAVSFAVPAVHAASPTEPRGATHIRLLSAMLIKIRIAACTIDNELEGRRLCCIDREPFANVPPVAAPNDAFGSRGARVRKSITRRLGFAVLYPARAFQSAFIPRKCATRVGISPAGPAVG